MAVLRSAVRVLPPLALLALLAQCRSRTEVELPLPEGAALVVHTADSMVAHGILRMLDAAADATVNDGTLKITLLRDGMVELGSAANDTAWLRATIAPGPLLARYKKEVDAALPMLRGALTTALQSQGKAPRDVGQMINDLLALPEQIAAIAMRIDNSPLQLGQGKKWSAYTLTVRARADTPMAALFASLNDSPAAPPLLPDVGDAMISARVSLPPALIETWGWAMKMLLAGGKQTLPSSAAWIEHSDGTLAMTGTLDSTLRLSAAYGLRDPAATAAAGEAMRAEWTRQAERYDAEIDNPPPHRGVALTHIRQELARSVLGMKEVEMHVGAAAGWSIFTVGGDTAFANARIDDALDGRIQRSALRPGVLMQARLDLGQMASALGGASDVPRLGNMLPQRAALTVRVDGDTLTFEARVD